MAAIRFLHSADWQLGMHRHFLDGEAQPRFAQARIDAVAALGRVAAEDDCRFVVAAGDLFESNQVDRRTVVRALEALAAIPVPVYLLPGNHDPLDAGSVFRGREFAGRRPAHVHLLDSFEPIAVAPGVEIVGVPWTSRRPHRDLVAEVLGGLPPALSGVTRIAVAHGIVDELAPDRADPALIAIDAVDAALADGRIHFFALGDRHSSTEVRPRVWYSGSPEATDYDEIDSGQALVITLDGRRCEVERRRVGSWAFRERAVELDSGGDVESLARWLDDQPDKDRTILKLRMTGTLDLRSRGALDDTLERAAEVYAAIEERRGGLAVLPDDADLSRMGLAGFARETLEQLIAAARAGDESGATARDALALLYRLAGGGER